MTSEAQGMVDLIDRRLASIDSEDESINRQIQGLTLRKAALAIAREQFLILKSELPKNVDEETSDESQKTPRASRMGGLNEPKGYIDGRPIRETFDVFFRSGTGTFTTQDAFEVARKRHPSMSREQVLNFLNYAKRMGRIGYESVGVYRFPDRTNSPIQPTYDDLYGEANKSPEETPA